MNDGPDDLFHEATVMHDSILNDTSPGVQGEQCLYAAVWSDGEVTLVTQDVAHPIGPDIQRPGVLVNRTDFLEWVASTFNVAVYDVDAVVDHNSQALIGMLEEFGEVDLVIDQGDVGFHEH